jgi:hypothetical protein
MIIQMPMSASIHAAHGRAPLNREAARMATMIPRMMAFGVAPPPTSHTHAEMMR